MKIEIEFDEYVLQVESSNFDGAVSVLSGTRWDDQAEQSVDLTDDECEAAGRKHETMIDIHVNRAIASARRDDQADQAAERAESREGWAA